MDVPWHAIVLVVSCKHGPEPGACLRDGPVDASAQFERKRRQFGSGFLGHGLAQHAKPPLPRRAADVGESEEVEGLGFPAAALGAVGVGKASEFNQAGFLFAQFQVELLQAFAEFRVEPDRVALVLEPHDEVVGIAYEDDLAARHVVSPPVHPEVQGVMQVDVRQQRADVPALRYALARLTPLAVFQDPGVQPFPDVPLHAPVRDTMLDEAHHPVMVHRVEEPPDVRVEHPAHLPLFYRYRDGVQRIMLAAAGPEPIRKSQEILLVDRAEHLHGRALDNLVLQRRDADRPFPPVRLRDVDPLDGPGAVRPALQARAQVLEVRFQGFPVARPRLPIDARRRVVLQRTVRLAQSIDVVDVVPQGRESPLLILLGRVAYPVQRVLQVHLALSPEPGLLSRIPLGQAPSLQTLRRPRASAALVRVLPRYYGLVRLPVLVHRGRTPTGFSARALPTGQDR